MRLFNLPTALIFSNVINANNNYDPVSVYYLFFYEQMKEKNYLLFLIMIPLFVHLMQVRFGLQKFHQKMAFYISCQTSLHVMTSNLITIY